MFLLLLLGFITVGEALDWARSSSPAQRGQSQRLPSEKHESWARCLRVLDGALTAGFYCFLCLSVLSQRLPGISSDHAIIPDEAHMTANAVRLSQYPLPWEGFDGTTSGPVNAYAIAWPQLLGLWPTLFFSRITGIGLLLLGLFCLSRGFRRVCPRGVRWGLIGLVAAFLASTGHPDFTHYSSEQVPLFLLSAAVGGLVSGSLSPLVIASVGLVLGAAPFAKLQASPVAAMLFFLEAVMIFAVTSREKALRLLVVLGGAALVPALLCLGPLVARGTIIHFFRSYLEFAHQYVAEPLSFDKVCILIQQEPLLWTIIAGLAVTSLALLVLSCVLYEGPIPKRTRWILFVSTLYVVGSYGIVITPGRLFIHYSWFILSGVTVLFLSTATFFIAVLKFRSTVACELSDAPWTAHQTRCRLFPAFFAVIPCGFIVAIGGHRLPVFRSGMFQEIFPSLPAATSSLEPFVPSGSRGLVYGWQPDWYLKFKLVPAAREPGNETQILRGSFVNEELQQYFRRRLLADLRRSRPEVVIEAVGPRFFAFHNPETHGIKAFPELHTYLHKHFGELRNAHTAHDCSKIYLRHRKLQELEERLVKVAEVRTAATTSEAANKLVDLRVDGEVCADEWLVGEPGGVRSGSVELIFEQEARVREIKVLNARNPQYGTSWVTVWGLSASGEELLLRREVPSYPAWLSESLDLQQASKAKGDGPPEDRRKALSGIKIAVEPAPGKSAGLSEVLVYREGQVAGELK